MKDPTTMPKPRRSANKSSAPKSRSRSASGAGSKVGRFSSSTEKPKSRPKSRTASAGRFDKSEKMERFGDTDKRQRPSRPARGRGGTKLAGKRRDLRQDGFDGFEGGSPNGDRKPARPRRASERLEKINLNDKSKNKPSKRRNSINRSSEFPEGRPSKRGDDNAKFKKRPERSTSRPARNERKERPERPRYADFQTDDTKPVRTSYRDDGLSEAIHTDTHNPNLIYGRNSVKVCLETNPDRVSKVMINEEARKDRRLDAIFELCKKNGISYQMVPKEKLNRLSEEVINHQGVAAQVSPKPLLNLYDIIKLSKEKTRKHPKHKPMLLLLDNITDPRNFGAILRVCDGADIDGVIVEKRHHPGFGEAVAKTASGAEETVPVAMVSNLSQAIATLKKEDYWIMGSSLGKKSVNYAKPEYDMSIALVMGSEGKGMSPLVEKNCDLLVQMPMHGAVDSLNVSVATGILSYAVRSAQEQN